MHYILSFLAVSPLTGFSTSYLDDRKYVAFQTYDVNCFIKSKIVCLKYLSTAVIKKSQHFVFDHLSSTKKGLKCLI